MLICACLRARIVTEWTAPDESVEQPWMNEQASTSTYAHPGSTSSSLLARVKAHDSDAWKRLVQLYGPIVFRRAQAGGLDADHAADVVQEVFAAVVRSIGEFDKRHEKGSFRAWLRTITSNKIVDVFRQLGRQPQAAGGSDAQQQFTNLADRPGPADEPSDADDRALLLWAALEQIRDDFQPHNWQAFWRTAVDGLPAVEVAEELGIKPDAVRRAKFRVLKRLRAELGELLD